MLKLSKNIWLGLLVVVSLNVYAAPPPETLVRKYSKTLASRKNADGKDITVVKLLDTRMPWGSQPSPEISLSGFPTLQEAPHMKVIIYPGTLEHGALEYAVEVENETRQVLGVGIEDPRPFAKINGCTYTDRYSLLQPAIITALEQVIHRYGVDVEIGVASFYHPIFYSNAKAVAFYTMAAVSEVTKNLGRRTNVEIVLLANHNAEMKKALEDEYQKRTEVRDHLLAHTPLKDIPDLYPTFVSYAEVNPVEEMEYFLRHFDKIVSSGNKTLIDRYDMESYSDFVGVLLNGSKVPWAPSKVMEAFRSTIAKVFASGKPNAEVLRTNIKSFAQKKFVNASNQIDEAKVEAETDRIMTEIAGIKDFKKVGVYAAIVNTPNSSFDEIEKAIERAVKK